MLDGPEHLGDVRAPPESSATRKSRFSPFSLKRARRAPSARARDTRLPVLAGARPSRPSSWTGASDRGRAAALLAEGREWRSATSTARARSGVVGRCRRERHGVPRAALLRSKVTAKYNPKRRARSSNDSRTCADASASTAPSLPRPKSSASTKMPASHGRRRARARGRGGDSPASLGGLSSRWSASSGALNTAWACFSPSFATSSTT